MDNENLPPIADYPWGLEKKPRMDEINEEILLDTATIATGKRQKKAKWALKELGHDYDATNEYRPSHQWPAE